MARSLLVLLVLLCASVPCINCGSSRVQRKNEMEAILTLATLHAAQARHLGKHGTYAAHLHDLDSRGTNRAYRFRLTPLPYDYALRAEPLDYGKTGRRTFYSDSSRIIRENWGPQPAGPHSREIR